MARSPRSVLILALLLLACSARARTLRTQAEGRSRPRTGFVNPWVEGLKAMQLSGVLYSRFLTGTVIPAMKATTETNARVMRSWCDVMAGKKTAATHVREMTDRTVSGLRYDPLIHTLGKQLFGSAKFRGEKVLAENDYFRLTYIPPRRGQPKQAAVFHVGGFLPYGDRIFRFLPETNLFKPMHDRGLPIYAMELKERSCSPEGRAGGADKINVGRCSLDRIIDTIDQFSDVAHRHNGHRMVLEGYCGLGIQALSYLAAKPETADRKFSVAALMVAPVEGRACKKISEVYSRIPDTVHEANRNLAVAMGSRVPGYAIGASMDVSLGALYDKSPAGRFTAGFENGSWAGVRRISDLTPGQRRNLAGAYWISPQCATKHPMPLSVIDLSSNLWRVGIRNGRIPARYHGRQLSLQAIRDNTKIKVVGFYGSKDEVVNHQTAEPLKQIFGQRYTHVVHPGAGHIAYVLSPERWSQAHKKAFDPNPVDVMLRLHSE
jgi:hypothetical protein